MTKYKTAILSLIKDENRYIENWLDYHYNLGIDKIYLFEDYDSKSHYSECIKYGTDKIRLLRFERIVQKTVYEPTALRQIQLLNFFIQNNPEKMDWVIFMDPDEYINLNKGVNLQDFLYKYRKYPAVYLAWKMFNANGHINHQKNDVDFYKQTTNKSIDNVGIHKHKSFINLNKKVKILDQHTIKNGVTTNYKQSFYDKDMSYDYCCLNHYFTRSWEDWCYQIYNRGDLRVGNRKLCDFFDLNEDMIGQKEELLKPLINKKINNDIWLDRNGLLYNGIRITDEHKKQYLNNVLWNIGPKRAIDYVESLYNNTYKNNKMKIALMYFCYDKDEKMLNLSLKTIDRLRKIYDIDVYVIDDLNHPMKEIPKNVIYWSTSFNRNFNLNGKEALDGVISCYTKIFNQNNYDWVIKVDPDTVVNTLEDFEIVDPEKYCNIGCGNHVLKVNEFKQNVFDMSVYGCMHGISKKGYNNIINNYKTLKIDNYIRLQEDLFISMLACNCDPSLNYFVYNFNNNPDLCNCDRGVYFNYTLQIYPHTNLDIGYEKLLKYNCITFKPLSWFNEDKTIDTKEELRYSSEFKMEKYVIFLLNM